MKKQVWQAVRGRRWIHPLPVSPLNGSCVAFSYLCTQLCVFCIPWVVTCKISGFRSSYVIWYMLYIIQYILYIIYYVCILAVMGFCCCVWAFSSCGDQGLLSSCGGWASHCGSFSCCRTWALGCSGFNSCGSQALEHSLSSCAWA